MVATPLAPRATHPLYKNWPLRDVHAHVKGFTCKLSYVCIVQEFNFCGCRHIFAPRCYKKNERTEALFPGQDAGCA